jgi:hypothetical protein
VIYRNKVYEDLLSRREAPGKVWAPTLRWGSGFFDVSRVVTCPEDSAYRCKSLNFERGY